MDNLKELCFWGKTVWKRGTKFSQLNNETAEEFDIGHRINFKFSAIWEDISTKKETNKQKDYCEKETKFTLELKHDLLNKN